MCGFVGVIDPAGQSQSDLDWLAESSDILSTSACSAKKSFSVESTVISVMLSPRSAQKFAIVDITRSAPPQDNEEIIKLILIFYLSSRKHPLCFDSIST